jgi:hypothetical protein
VKTKIIQLLLLGFGIFLLSFKSTQTISISKTDKLKEGYILAGGGQQKVFINHYIVVGIMDSNSPYLDSIATTLKSLNLVWDDSKVIRTDFGLPPYSINFNFFKREDKKSISYENSLELKKLRELYWNNFGPGIYDSSGRISGVLSNSLTVKFKRGIDKDSASQILTSYEATKFIEVRVDEYHVEFPKSWGYKILDVAKEINEYNEVQYVENQIQTIIRPD